MYVCMYVFMYSCMYVCVYVCMYIRMYVYTYVRMYICTHIIRPNMYVYVRVFISLSVCMCTIYKVLYINAGMLTMHGGQVCPNFGGEGVHRLRIWLLSEAGRGHCVRRQQTLKKTKFPIQ